MTLTSLTLAQALVAIFRPMFQHIFNTELAAITSDKDLIENLWEEIKRSYSKPGRYYHSLSHLDNLVSELIPVKDQIADWQTLVFSIAYHDIIYNTVKNDNEEQSAKIAYDRLSKLSIPASQKEKCFNQIMATKRHAISDDDDTNFFIDADLTILGADYGVYHQYSTMIRKEYKLYPDFVYKSGRQKVLRHFLQMKNIYKTAYFRNKYEMQARKNLTDELKELSST
ncbi:HD domain-containing protein [Terrimonas alba]|uniref:HD domain-containing protein n=1 Tax=Terrimonas alba TaxID=3349636 RepID=UPI0035F2EF67